MINLGKAELFFKRNGATILTVLGGVGVVATTIMAVNATPKALDILKQVEEEKGEKLTKLEAVINAAPVYIPTAVMGVTSIVCIFGANVLNKKHQASLASAYALLDSSYKKYRAKVVDFLGQDSEREIRDEIVKDTYAGDDISIDNDKQLFYDEYSHQYFESTLYAVQRAEYEVNRDISMMGYALLNEFYESLGADPIEGGDELGWSDGGNFARYWQSWVDFNHRKVTMDDGLECIIISTFMEPYMDWDDDWDK